MAKERTTTNVDAGNDVSASWGDEVRADIGALFDDKTVYAETDGATITFNMNNGAFQKVTMEGNRTLAVSNALLGRAFCLILKQDGTGSRVPVWFAGITWAYGTAPVLTTTADKHDIFTFIEITEGVYMGVVVAQNI